MDMSALDPKRSRDFISRVHRCGEALRNLAVPLIARNQGYSFWRWAGDFRLM